MVLREDGSKIVIGFTRNTGLDQASSSR